MALSTAYTIKDFAPEYAQELVTMWRRSFEEAVGIIDPHPLSDQVQYLINEVVPNNSVRVVFESGSIIGFIAANRESINQLYLAREFQGRGIGTHLVNWAKKNSNGSLWLYTFQRNKGAQAFYEKRGFKVVNRGFEPMWQLEDIKYEWRADTSH